MNGREVGNRYLVGSGVAAPGLLAPDFAANGIMPNNFVIYDLKTNETLGPGITYQDYPEIGIAQAVDLNGDGIPDALRPVGGGKLDGNTISSVNTRGARTGMNKIKDVFFRCTNKDTDYSLSVSWRNDNTLDTNLDNQWSYKTLSVNLKEYNCDTCEGGIDCKAVACAFANQFNESNSSSRDMGFVKRSRRLQLANTGVEVYPILDKEVQYCIKPQKGECNSCNEMTGISGITIKDSLNGLSKTINFPGAVNSNNKSFFAQQDRIIKLINAAFKQAKIQGHAAAIEQLKGSGRPCTEFTILINSCNSVELLDAEGNALTPCIAEYNPYDGVEFKNDATCVGCTPGTSFTPNCGLRVVGKPVQINCDCSGLVEQPLAWYFTDVDITTTEQSNFDTWYTRTFQDIVVPEGLGSQYHLRMLNQVASGPGFDYISGMDDVRGLYRTNKAAELKYNTIGLNCKGLYRSITFKHGITWNSTHSNDLGAMAKWVTWLLIEESDTKTKTDLKAILDGWLGSLPRLNVKPLELVDEVEADSDSDDSEG